MQLTFVVILRLFIIYYLLNCLLHLFELFTVVFLKQSISIVV